MLPADLPPEKDTNLTDTSPVEEVSNEPASPPTVPLPGTFGDEEFAVRKDGYKIKVDRELCIGAASCVALAPEIFQLDNEGIAIITDPDGTLFEALMDAAKSCPTNAIIVEDNEGNQVWP